MACLQAIVVAVATERRLPDPDAALPACERTERSEKCRGTPISTGTILEAGSSAFATRLCATSEVEVDPREAFGALLVGGEVEAHEGGFVVDTDVGALAGCR
jgi:hypothetical protein